MHLAKRVGSQERLKMLALMTYADIGSVNPTSLSPWKAENLWRVYFATANHLNRSVDDERFHLAGHDEQVARIRLLAPQLGRRLRDFLEGLPQRYLVCTPLKRLFSTWRWLHSSVATGVQTQLKRLRGDFALTVITQRSSRSVCHPGRSAGWMGHEHPQGGRLFE